MSSHEDGDDGGGGDGIEGGNAEHGDSGDGDSEGGEGGDSEDGDSEGGDGEGGDSDGGDMRVVISRTLSPTTSQTTVVTLSKELNHSFCLSLISSLVCVSGNNIVHLEQLSQLHTACGPKPARRLLRRIKFY